MITIDFENRCEFGLCECIYAQIKTQILNGTLLPDEKLPSKRSFAEHLGVSVITIQNAYARLISEGYLYSIEKKGFFVTNLTLEDFPDFSKLSKNLPTENDSKIFLPQFEKTEFFTDFRNNSTSSEKFPFTLWTHLMRKVLKTNDERLLSRIPANGVFELRKAIAKYLLEFRNMNVSAEQIVIGAGTESLYTMIVQFLGRDKLYAVENPGYHKVAKIFELNGAKVVPVDIDESGINSDLLEKSSADVVHISPAHHFPTGVVMPVKRRREILSWANAAENRFIIEDDYDSEFRFNGKPLQTLQNADENAKVIYINTFSKTLSPSFRISYMVLPERIVKDFFARLGFYSCPVSAFEQFTLAEFINQGFFGKHIIRMKNYYRNLRNNLINQLEASKISSIAKINEEESGLHFLLKLNSPIDGKKLQQKLEEHKIRIPLLSDFYYTKNLDESSENPTFVLNYSGIQKERISETVRRMEDSIIQS